MNKVFIDGQEGTTGLQIRDRLLKRSDITLLEIPSDKRKDPAARKEFLNSADLCILCLPDDAARESVALIDNKHTRVIDASTAHRTLPHFAYGLPELSDEHREAIKKARFTANPGCHATGFILAVYPMVAEKLIPNDKTLICHSLTGYSGGGKKMIASFEAPENRNSPAFIARPYALSLKHKHLPEMRVRSGLLKAPLFYPVVCNFYNGMVVSTFFPLDGMQNRMAAREVHALFEEWYANKPFVKVMPFDSAASLMDNTFLSPVAQNGTNQLDLFVFGNDEQVVVAARFDNLGKGASGAAVQNMNLMFGLNETEGL